MPAGKNNKHLFGRFIKLQNFKIVVENYANVISSQGMSLR